jgi:hypothetical protein
MEKDEKKTKLKKAMEARAERRTKMKRKKEKADERKGLKGLKVAEQESRRERKEKERMVNTSLFIVPNVAGTFSKRIPLNSISTRHRLTLHRRRSWPRPRRRSRRREK